MTTKRMTGLLGLLLMATLAIALPACAEVRDTRPTVPTTFNGARGDYELVPSVYVLASAQEPAEAPAETPDDAPAGIPLSPILLVLSVLTTLLPLTKLIPGWATISNIALGLVSALTAAFTGLAEAHPTATLVTLGLTALGAILGYFRSEKRAAGTPIAQERIDELRG